MELVTRSLLQGMLEMYLFFILSDFSSLPSSKGHQQSSVAYPTLLSYHPIQNIIEFRTT